MITPIAGNAIVAGHELRPTSGTHRSPGLLWLLGVPLPLLWGLLVFITNYIPNVGFIIGLVPPAL
jgi:hypothetical protein